MLLVDVHCIVLNYIDHIGTVIGCLYVRHTSWMIHCHPRRESTHMDMMAHGSIRAIGMGGHPSMPPYGKTDQWVNVGGWC